MDGFQNLKETLDNATALIARIQDDLNRKEKRRNDLLEETKVLEEIISEKEELELILNKCSNDLCPHKLAFKKIKDQFDPRKILDQNDFHFFMCYRGNHYARSVDNRFLDKTVLDYHREVIEKEGYCWWAKFNSRKLNTGAIEKLEPFGESIDLTLSSDLASFIKQSIKERVASGGNVYLFNYNPNPPDIELSVAKVVDFFFGHEDIPYLTKNREKPECAYFPSYYFEKRDGNCASCKQYDPARCSLKFYSNFYFKIDKIHRIKEENINNEFLNLRNCFTNDFINFAIPIFYPLIVTQEMDIDYFFDIDSLERVVISKDARKTIEELNFDPRIINIIKILEYKLEFPVNAKVQKFKSRDNITEIRYSGGGRVFVDFSDKERPLVDSIDSRHRHSG